MAGILRLRRLYDDTGTYFSNFSTEGFLSTCIVRLHCIVLELVGLSEIFGLAAERVCIVHVCIAVSEPSWFSLVSPLGVEPESVEMYRSGRDA